MAKTATEPLITIENQSRKRLIFQIDPKPGAPVDQGPYLVIGDSIDSDDAIRARGVPRDPKLTPSPIQRITRAEWNGLGVMGRNVLRDYAEQDIVRISGLEAADLALEEQP